MAKTRTVALALTPDRFRIWQRPDYVTFQFEWNRLFYQVDLTGRKTEDPLMGVNIGVSKGRWQGDTLVVKSDNFTDQTLIDSLTPHSDAMTLTQQFRLIDANTLEDRITIEDPQTFTRPWEAIVTYKRQPDAPFPEDVCIDRRKAGKMPLPLKRCPSVQAFRPQAPLQEFDCEYSVNRPDYIATSGLAPEPAD